MKKDIVKYLIEFIIVAFGVFLGIYVNELQNEKRTEKEKEKSINYILEELEDNKKSLEKAIAYHESIKIEIDSIFRTLDEKDLYVTYLGNKIIQHNEIKGWNGVGIATLENTAFEAAKISGIMKEYGIELIRYFSKIYNHQEAYSKFGNTILTKMINVNSSTKVIDVVGSIQLMTSDVLNYEKSLLNGINTVKSTLKTSHNGHDSSGDNNESDLPTSDETISRQ